MVCHTLPRTTSFDAHHVKTHVRRVIASHSDEKALSGEHRDGVIMPEVRTVSRRRYRRS